MSRHVCMALAGTCLFLGGVLTAQEIEIQLVNGTEAEERARAQLSRLLEEYDLTPWIFTYDVAIEARVVPHSHPVLTLNTRYLDDDVAQLSTFVHEQIHWSLDADTLGTQGAINELREIYPTVPVGRPAGARSEFSSYLHLIVCWLELDAMVHFVGERQARHHLGHMNHYQWIYEHVLGESDRIGAVVRRHDLVIDTPSKP